MARIARTCTWVLTLLFSAVATPVLAQEIPLPPPPPSFPPPPTAPGDTSQPEITGPPIRFEESPPATRTPSTTNTTGLTPTAPLSLLPPEEEPSLAGEPAVAVAGGLIVFDAFAAVAVQRRRHLVRAYGTASVTPR